jgi:Bacterial nucleoid DNA-binding protein
MNYADLTKQLSKRLQLPKADIEKRLDILVTVLTEELQDDKVVSILNFGNLEVKKRNERVTIHPVSGKKMLVPPKLIVKFKPAGSLNKKVKALRP